MFTPLYVSHFFALCASLICPYVCSLRAKLYLYNKINMLFLEGHLGGKIFPPLCRIISGFLHVCKVGIQISVRKKLPVDKLAHKGDALSIALPGEPGLAKQAKKAANRGLAAFDENLTWFSGAGWLRKQGFTIM